MTPNPAFKDETEKGDNQVDRQTSPHICPISGLEMNGKFKFCFFWTCGCVMSERALKQFVEKVCVSCQKPFTDADVVILNAVDEDLERMNKLRENRSSAMKSKKQKNKKTAESTEKSAEIKVEKSETTTGTQKNGQIPSAKSMKLEKPDGGSVAGSSKFYCLFFYFNVIERTQSLNYAKCFLISYMSEDFPAPFTCAENVILLNNT